MKYYLIAGEASGDLHGSNLMKGLFAEDSRCEVRFWGGDKMASVGGTMVRHYKETAVMGVSDVLMKAGKIVGNLKLCKKDILEYRPDAVILIDYPGFNMKIARFAKRHNFKVLYYIAPKVWARGEGRIRKIRRYVDRMYIIFPFEREYFRKRDVPFDYYGNPLLDSISETDFHPVCDGGRTIALLAGSRQAELKFLMPKFVALERLLKQDRRFEGYKLIVAGAPSMSRSDYSVYLPDDSSIQVTFGQTYQLLRQSDAAVISSGTASLEAALIGTPQVVCYGFNKLTYAIAKSVVHVRYISLANLILDKLIFRELIQDEAAPEKIYEELCRLVFDDDTRKAMKLDYDSLRETLGGTGASRRVAAAITSFVKD